jgi:tetratricopeptide (TPR) repeat protein
VAIYRQTLGDDQPALAAAWNNLALIQDAQGKYAEAERALRQSLAIDRIDHPWRSAKGQCGSEEGGEC